MSNLHNTIYTRLFLFSVILVGYTISAKAAMPDSIGMEMVNGQKIIIHKLTPKETYYGLSRQYNVSAQQIIAANGNKQLKVGDTVRIPIGTASASKAVMQANSDDSLGAEVPDLAPDEYLTYKVGNNETLNTISKRFGISVASIKRANGLTDETLSEGLLLKVPNEELPPPMAGEPAAALADVIADESAANEKAFELPTNKYGIREMTEKGIGVWLEDLNQAGGNMLALHKTAPVGTVVKITNPMTNRTTFAKVVGKFADTAETSNAIIVISKSAATLIGALDRRFQVEIAYGAPNAAN